LGLDVAVLVRVAAARIAGFVSAFTGAGAGLVAASATVSLVAADSSSAGVSAAARPIVLESVRWQLSHATIVRTRLPRCRSSFLRFRVRSQKEQYPVSMVTLICPGLRFIVIYGSW